MKFQLVGGQIYVPDGLPEEAALARTTHMAIGAHPDDLEIMAIDGILRCYQREDRWFTGVVVTNGSGSARAGLYKDYSDEDMRKIRIEEQKKAATVGEYGAQVFLDYPSASVKDSTDKRPVEDLVEILKIASPEVVYVHNLADKHDTHIGVTMKVIEAARSLDEYQRPKHLNGCEVWRDLDWMLDEDKVTFNTSAQENLQAALVGVFDSQISGGKRYDLATLGRRRANATYYASHSVDLSTGMVFAMDLTPLIKDPQISCQSYIQEHIQRFANDVSERITKMG